MFQWNGQWYAVMENKDIGLLYRGVSLKPVNFNDDGTIIIPDDDCGFPADGRKWQFELSTMGWKALEGTCIKWNSDGLIKGKVNGNALIESPVWLLTELDKYQTLVIRIKNKSKAKQAKIWIASTTPKGAFWEHPGIDWEEEDQILINLDSESKEFKEYTIDLSKLPNLEPMLKRIRIEPAIGVDKGNWEIEYISIQ